MTIVGILVPLIFAFLLGRFLAHRAKESEKRDAARYRHLRGSWEYTDRERHRLDWPRLEWYLPRYYGMDLGIQLDKSIDRAISRSGWL